METKVINGFQIELYKSIEGKSAWAIKQKCLNVVINFLYISYC